MQIERIVHTDRGYAEYRITPYDTDAQVFLEALMQGLAVMCEVQMKFNRGEWDDYKREDCVKSGQSPIVVEQIFPRLS